MADQFIDIQSLIPEKLRNEPLLQDCVAALEYIYYERERNVAQQLADIRDKYATYLVLSTVAATDTFRLSDAVDADGVPAYTVVTPTVTMDEPLIKRERLEFSFGAGTHQFITTALSLESIATITKGLPIGSIRQISSHQEHMREGFFEENCLYELTCAVPVAFSFVGLSHGQMAPIARIEDPTLGLVYDSRDLRGSDLYALEPGFPYHVYSDADSFEWVLVGKVRDPVEVDLGRERNTQIISEFGYQYLLDALDLTALDVALIRSFITAIHQLKGSRKGVQMMLDLLELNDYVQLFEWWEDDPEGITAEPMTYRTEVDLTRDDTKFRGEALQALRLFLRQYVYPVMADFALLINFVDDRLRTGYNVLTHQTLNGVVSSPLVIGTHIRTEQSVPSDGASPVVIAVQGLTEFTYTASMAPWQDSHQYQFANAQLNTAVNVLPHMTVPGISSTQVLIGMGGVSHHRNHGSVDSPIMLTANGVVDREISVTFQSSVAEYTVELPAYMASGTKGFVKYAQPSAAALSPLVLTTIGLVDRELVAEFVSQSSEALVDFKVYVNSGTHLFYKQSHPASSQASPLLMFVGGVTDRTIPVTMTGDAATLSV